MSFRLMEAFMGRDKLVHPKLDDFINMRKSLIGGRCISLNGIYNDIACLDVKSLYPAAMAYYDQPYGKYRKVKKRPENELGIYYVQVTPCEIKHHGFFPLKNNGEVKYSNILEPYTDWYTSVDIDIGIAEGHKIKYVAFDDDEGKKKED